MVRRHTISREAFRGWAARAGALLRKRAFIIFVVLSYLAFSCYYLGPSVTSCSSVVYGFGDNTAGPIWRHSVSPNSPLWGFTHATNYPYGENLYSPVHYSSLLQYTTYWVSQEIFGSVCGMNVVNLLGFFTAALVMFGFIYWLTRNKWIAWLAGYAVSFSPYFQYKVGGHPSYGYSALLIACLWLFFKALQSGKIKDAILLGVLYAANFYWDPYFSLLSTLVMAPVFVIWLVFVLSRRRVSSASAAVQAKRLAVAAAVAVLLILPLLGLEVVDGKQINSQVAGTRGDIMVDAQMCSNLPWDYILPADSNYFANKLFGAGYSARVTALRHRCNPSEYMVGVSYVLLLITGIGLIVFAWEKLQRRALFDTLAARRGYGFILCATLAVLLVAVLFALPPHIGRLKLPSYYLLHLVTIWRILSRIFLDVNIAIVTIVSLVLAYMARQPFMAGRRKRTVVFLVIFLGIFAQYQSFRPLSGSLATFSYKTDLPATYYWLRDQADIKSVAAYPLDKVGESDAISIYLTGQFIHKKPLLNSTLGTGPEQALHYAIKDISDPQTLPVLRRLGVDALEIHGLTPADLRNIDGIKVVHYEQFVNHITGGKYIIAKILPGRVASDAILLEKGFPINGDIMKTPASIEYETISGATLQDDSLAKDAGSKTGKPVLACFDAKTTYPGNDQLTAMQGSKILGVYPLGGTYRHIVLSVPTGEDVTLKSKTGANMRLDNLGCER